MHTYVQDSSAQQRNEDDSWTYVELIQVLGFDQLLVIIFVHAVVDLLQACLQARELNDEGVSEVHVVGKIEPTLRTAWYMRTTSSRDATDF